MSTSQLVLELSLIGVMLLVTSVFWVRNYDKADSCRNKSSKDPNWSSRCLYGDGGNRKIL